MDEAHRKRRPTGDAVTWTLVHTAPGPVGLDGTWIVPRRAFCRALLRPFQAPSWAPLLAQVALDLPRCRCLLGGSQVRTLDEVLPYVARRGHPRLVLALLTQACLADLYEDLVTAAAPHFVGEPDGGGAHDVHLAPDGTVHVCKVLRCFHVDAQGDAVTDALLHVDVTVDGDDAGAPVVVSVVRAD